jgi:hypothetical protein
MWNLNLSYIQKTLDCIAGLAKNLYHYCVSDSRIYLGFFAQIFYFAMQAEGQEVFY